MALRLRYAEWVLLGYAGFVVVVGVARVGRYPMAGWAVAAHLLVMVLVGLFQHPRLGATGQLLRHTAPIGLLLALYGALDLLSGFGAIPTHDAAIQRWEAVLFGEQVSRLWWQRYPSEMWSWVLHAAYFAYYVVVPFPVVYHLLDRQPERAQVATFAILLGFALCYTMFIVIPVAGPYYEFPRPADWFTANPPARAVYGLLSSGSSYGAAFPSSHVAAAWISVAATAIGSRRWAAGLTIPAALLTIGVVYCQMHYAVDAVAGVAVAGVTIVTAGRIARGS